MLPRIAATFLLEVAICAIANAKSPYTLSCVPGEQTDKQLTVAIQTNIPGTIKVSVSLTVAGQKDDEVYIGTSVDAEVVNGSGSAILDVSMLPSGNYTLETAFYPFWGFSDEISQASGIRDDIHTVARKPVILKNGHLSATDEKAKLQGQLWVMEHVNSSLTWNEGFWRSKFGNFDEVTVDSQLSTVKGYYFRRIDMTIFVNSNTQKTMWYSKGKASK
jgi:hypothetical protein